MLEKKEIYWLVDMFTWGLTTHRGRAACESLRGGPVLWGRDATAWLLSCCRVRTCVMTTAATRLPRTRRLRTPLVLQ